MASAKVPIGKILTEKERAAFNEVRTFFDQLSDKYGQQVVNWALQRKLNWDREKNKLIKEKDFLSLRINQIEEDLK